MLAALVEAVDARNELVRDWHRRAVELDAPEHTSPLAPPAEHGGIGRVGSGVVAGRRRVVAADVDGMLARLLSPSVHNGVHSFHPVLDEEFLAEVAAIDAPAAEPDAAARWFRHRESGNVIQYDREPNEIERRGLVEISRAEALGG